MNENRDMNSERLRQRRKDYIREGDAAISGYAWNQFKAQNKLADTRSSLPNNTRANNNNADFHYSDNVATRTNEDETSKNSNPILSANADVPIDCDAILQHLLVDVSTVNMVGGEPQVSNIPNTLMNCADEELDMRVYVSGTNDVNNIFDQTHDKCSEKKEAFEKLLNSHELHKTINASPAITQAELYLMYLKHGLENHLSHTGFSSLFRMFNISLGEDVLPPTRHMLDEKFNGLIKVEYHALCHKCSLYLGEMEVAVRLVQCPNCLEPLELMNPSSVNYFIIIDPSESIKGLVEQSQDFYHYVVNERESEVNHIKDIFDGYCYKELRAKIKADGTKDYLTVNINTDEAPRFESSNYSIWPIYMMPNEIPMELIRPIVCGLWFGRHKPNMIPFLGPFVEAFNKISRKGIRCIIKNKEIKLKLFVACVTVDSSARTPMQGLKQYNGYFSCNWCEQEGVFQNGVRFPYLDGDEEAPKRDPVSIRRDMETAVENGTCIKGVQALSPFIGFRYFNIVFGFGVDYLHAALEGSGQQFTKILEKDLTPQDIKLIDKILLEIKAPHQIARLSRPFSERAQWKAREWENWILYYSFPIFFFILHAKFPHKVMHWSFLVRSLHILLQSDITINELNEVHCMLHKFVIYVGVVYKDLSYQSMTFNTHLMLHLSESVYNWGPLFTHSTFAFESGNMQVLQAIKCAKGVIQQVARYINMQYCLFMLEVRVYPSAAPAVKEFCDVRSVQKTFKLSDDGPLYFGRGTLIGRQILSGFNLSKTRTRGFLKMLKAGCIYSSCRTDNDRSCNFYAQLNNGTFVKIDLFIIDEEKEEEFTLCFYVKTKSWIESNNPLQLVEKIKTKLHIVPTREIRTVCIFQCVNQINYICPLPNLYHY